MLSLGRQGGFGAIGRFGGAAWLALLLAVVVGVAAGLGGCAGAPAARPLTRELRAETFDRYWGELDRHYPFFDLAGVDWRAERARWRDRAVEAPTPAEFYAALAGMLSTLNDPHVMLRPPTWAREGGAGAALRGSRRWRDRISAPYLSVVWVERRPYVRRWPEGSRTETGDRPPRSGYPEVLAVDGVRPARNMLPLLMRGPEGRPVEVEVEWADGRREIVRVPRPPAALGPWSGDRGGRAAGVSGEAAVVRPAMMEGTVLEHRQTLHREVAIRWDDGTVSWLDFDGGVRTPEEFMASGAGERGARVAERAGFGAAADTEGEGGMRSVRRRSWGEWLSAADLGEVGYLRLSTLDYEDAAGGITLSRMVEAFDEAVNWLGNKRGLVLDLRSNGGGRPRSLAAVAGRFMLKHAELSSPDRRLLWLVPYKYVTAIPPREPVFKGRLVVLVNEETGSAAEHLAAILRRERGAIIVGERTSGAEALVEIVRGPDGSELRYGWLRFVDKSGRGLQGEGVAPDVEVKLTIDRVREIGYAGAVREAERTQFVEACRVLGVDGEEALRQAGRGRRVD